MILLVNKNVGHETAISTHSKQLTWKTTMLSNIIYTPYCYLIGWTSLNKWYYGVRFAKNCHPSDFWVSYFTSSKHVKQLRAEHGEPDVIEIRKTFNEKTNALIWEHKVLRRLKANKDSRFVNISIGLGAGYADHTGRKQSEQHKQRRADSHRGQKHPKSCGQKISAKAKGKTLVRDSNNNCIKVSLTDPRYLSGELISYMAGHFNARDSNGNSYFITKDDLRYISGELHAQSKGRVSPNKRPYTEEEIAIRNIKTAHSLVNSRKGLLWIHCGKQVTRVHPIVFDEYYKSRGWTLGRE